MRSVAIVLALVVLATVVAALADRFRAPAPSLLALAGLAVGAIPGVPEVRLAPQTVALLVLPPLLYATAVEVSLPDLRRVARPVGVLAIGLVIASAAAIAAAAHALVPQLSWRVALVVGAVLASTDPVAVSALARRLGLPRQLLALVQGESLLNDATSLVFFRVAVALVAGDAASAPSTVLLTLRLAGGGLLAGALVGIGASFLAWRMRDPVLLTVVALAAPYGAYLAAESVGASGVTAVVTAGLWRSGRRGRSPSLGRGAAQLQVAAVYEVVVFLLESVIFAVIGLEVPSLLRHLPAGDRGAVLSVFALMGVLLATRTAWVYAMQVLPAGLRRRRQQKPSPRGGWRVPAVLSWAGTRGVVPIAAALSVPEHVHGVPFPHRDLVIVLAAGTTLLTLVVQGLTLAPLVRRLDVQADPGHLADELARGRRAAAEAAARRLDELVEAEAMSQVVARLLRTHVEERLAAATEPSLETDRVRLQLDLLHAEGRRLRELREAGEIGEATRRQLQRALDREEAALEER